MSSFSADNKPTPSYLCNFTCELQDMKKRVNFRGLLEIVTPLLPVQVDESIIDAMVGQFNASSDFLSQALLKKYASSGSFTCDPKLALTKS